MISMLYMIYCTQDSQLLFPTAKSVNNAQRVNDSPVVREMVMSRAFYLCLTHTQKKHCPIYGFFRHRLLGNTLYYLTGPVSFTIGLGCSSAYVTILLIGTNGCTLF